MIPNNANPCQVRVPQLSEGITTESDEAMHRDSYQHGS